MEGQAGIEAYFRIAVAREQSQVAPTTTSNESALFVVDCVFTKGLRTLRLLSYTALSCLETWVSAPATRTRTQACPCPSAYFTEGNTREAAMVNARVTSAFRPHRDTTSLRKRSASKTSRSRTALAKRKPSVASGGKAARSPAKIARKVGGLTPSRSAIVTTNWVHGPQSSAKGLTNVVNGSLMRKRGEVYKKGLHSCRH